MCAINQRKVQKLFILLRVYTCVFCYISILIPYMYARMPSSPFFFLDSGLKRKIIEGVHPMDLAIKDEGFTPISAKFSRFAGELFQHARFKRLRTNRDVPEVYIRIGPPGTGKSRWLDEQYGLDIWIETPDNTGKWFDGCELADILVFDEVCFGSVPLLDIFKKLTDRYPFRGAINGGFTWLKLKVIVFTSSSHPFE